MRDDVILLAGSEETERTPWRPFDPRAVDFLSDLSELLLRTPGFRQWEEVCAFGFWCRRSKLERMAGRYGSSALRLGVGRVFHIAPSNVPTMFAYTAALGLLAGNSNVVRLPARRTEGAQALLEAIDTLLRRGAHQALLPRLSFLHYPRGGEATAFYSAQCDGRVVWGGDETVASLRSIPLPPHAAELFFPDRWSLALFSQAALSRMEDSELAELARRFYNDTYSMDQNACSSPQLVLWLTDGGTSDVRTRWWEALAAEAQQRYPLSPFQSARKLERFTVQAMTGTPTLAGLTKYGGNLLWVADLAAPPAGPDYPKGGFGLFYQYAVSALEEVLPMLSPKVQTLVCGGLSPRETAEYLAEHQAAGVDRIIVPGQALELDAIWDGKDVIAALSRIIGGCDEALSI